MNQCLRCNKFYVGTAVFCERCQLSLLDRSQRKNDDPAPFLFPPVQVVEQVQTKQQAPTLPLPGEDTCPSDQKETPLSLPATAELQSAHERQQRRLLRMRRVFIWLSLLAVIALVVDGVLIALVTVTRLAHNSPTAGIPTLTLSQTIVFRGQVLSLHLSHCQPLSHIILTHDIQEPLHIDTPSSLVQINSLGEADVHVLIDGNWSLGIHRIQGQDVRTHYAFSTTLQVMGTGPIQPPQLQIRQSKLDMGIALQGQNSTQMLTLNNMGGGTVAWIANSDQPWLLVTPAQGVFSGSQTISIAVSRANLAPGNYKGNIAIASNTGAPVSVEVRMVVQPLPTTAGAILEVLPPALSFTTTDGETDTAEQVLLISNPGSRPLSWSLSSSAPTFAVNQNGALQEDTSWLTAQPSSQTIVPHSSVAVHVVVHSHLLVASMYNGTLTVTTNQSALNSSQMVAVSLNVQQRCGIETSADMLSFRIPAEQHAPISQLLGLSAANGCADSIPWQAFPLADWLNITPASGRIQVSSTVTPTVEVNSAYLKPGSYTGFIMLLTLQRSKVISVQLTVLPSFDNPAATSAGSASSNKNGTPATSVASGSTTLPDAPGVPALGLSSSTVSFTATQGIENPPAQAIDIVDTGGGTFSWQARVNSSNASWLLVTPSSGMASPGLFGQVTMSINSTGLAPGSYHAQIAVAATDTSGIAVTGAPQSITVTLTVLPPCSVQVAPTSLSFSSSPLQANPPGQSLTIRSVGGCARPISWGAQVDRGSQNWLMLSSSSGLEDGTGSIITVTVNAHNMLLGGRGQITFTAVDSTDTSIPNSTQTIVVTLSLL